MHGTVAEPALPRWKRAAQRGQIGEGKRSFPQTTKDYYRKIKFEALDVLIAAIADGHLESLLLKSLKGKDVDGLNIQCWL